MKFRDIIKDILIAENEGPSDHVKWVAKQILARFMFADDKEQRGFMHDYNLDVGGESTFLLGLPDTVDDSYLEYTFEIEVESYPSFTPGTWDEPADYDPAIYDFVITQLTVYEHSQEIYKGPDFTNFINLKVGEQKMRYGAPHPKNGSNFIYDYFGEAIEEYLNDNKY